MKKNVFSLIALFLCGVAFQLNAQADISDIFKAGIADFNKVAEGYLTPAGNSFASGLGSNWYNTAKTHKVLGFDLRIGVDGVQVPASDRMFSLSGLTNLKPANANITQAPTFAGSGDGVQLNLMQPRFLSDGHTANPMYDNGAGVITSFTTPSGVSRYVPTASVQLTLGLPLGNDVMVRFIPAVGMKGVEVSQWGIGIKHNIKQWIPVVKLLPFDASVLVAYTRFNINYAFPVRTQITPDKLVGEGVEYIADPETNINTYKTQGIVMNADALTANVIVSKKLAFLTPYIGLGITKTNFDLTMAGNYPTLGDPVLSEGTYKIQIDNMTDPIDISSSQIMPGATIGLRAKILFVLSVNAQYTMQKYPTASVGFGITFR